jgi:localization factor PodJL
MSVWRIDKVDAQTRALAEAAAKAAGLPLGMWLERAIMRRVENRAAPAQPPIIPAAVEEPAAAPEPDLSPEMKSALEAAERRRHRRGDKSASGGRNVDPAPETKPTAADLADPFAAPEPDNHDRPFEQPLETASAAEAIDPDLKLEEDLPIVISDEPQPVDPLFASAADAETIAPPQPADIAPPAAAVAELPPLVAPSWQDASEVTTTGRQSVVPSQAAASTPSRRPSSLPFIGLGLLVVIAAGAGAYFFLVDSGPQKPPAVASPAAPSPPAEPAKPVEQAAAPKPEPPPAAAQPTPAPQPAETAPSPAPPPPPVQEQAQPAPVPPALRPTGPSLANLGVPDAPAAPAPLPQIAPTVPTAAALPPPASQVGRPPLAGEALPALRNRAEAGDMEAQMELGRRYIEGIGVGRNEAEAGKWLLRAADQGNAQAQFNVGVMYERGVGLAPSLPKALEYYRKSAAQQTPMALHNLALFHMSEQPGYKADPVQARRMMTQAAELGLAESQYSLALMHLQGVGGPADRVLGLSWMGVAARPNMPQLIEAVRQLSTQFTEAERLRARDLAGGHVRRIQANLQRLRTSAGTAPAAASAAAADAAPGRPRIIDRAAIMEMQKLLAGMKIYGGTADGALGPRTTAAIKEFQTMAGMPVDGKPSVELLDHLRDVAGLGSQ